MANVETMKALAKLEIRQTAISRARHILAGDIDAAKTVNTGLIMMVMNYTTIGLLTNDDVSDAEADANEMLAGA